MKHKTDNAVGFKALGKVLEGAWGTIGPEFVNACKKVATRLGAGYSLVTFSVTAALESILRGWSIGYGDEVIVAAWSDPVDAMVTAAVGATPVFADVCPNAPILSPEAARLRVTKNTKAVIADMAGDAPCFIKELAAYCQRAKLYCILNLGDVWEATIDGHPITHYADAAFIDMSQGRKVDVGLAGAALTDSKENWDLFYACHNCGRPFGTGSTLSGESSIGGDLRIAEWQAALIPRQLELLQPTAEAAERKRAFMPRQPFFTDQYFVKLTGCQTLYTAADYPNSLQAEKEAFGSK